MTKKIEFNHIFACTLAFGLVHKSVVLVAENEAKAKELLFEYYDEPEIVYLISLQELLNLQEQLKNNAQEFYLVVVLEENETGSRLTHHQEWGATLEALQQGKYLGKDAIFLDRVATETILHDTLVQFLVEPTEGLKNGDSLEAPESPKEDSLLSLEATAKLRSILKTTRKASGQSSQSTVQRIEILISDEFDVQ